MMFCVVQVLVEVCRELFCSTRIVLVISEFFQLISNRLSFIGILYCSTWVFTVIWESSQWYRYLFSFMKNFTVLRESFRWYQNLYCNTGIFTGIPESLLWYQSLFDSYENISNNIATHRVMSEPSLDYENLFDDTGFFSVRSETLLWYRNLFTDLKIVLVWRESFYW